MQQLAIVRALMIAIALTMASRLCAQNYLPVYGSPGYAPANGGYQPDFLYIPGGAFLDQTGNALTRLASYAPGGARNGTVAMLWGASGAPQAMTGLGADSAGKFFTEPRAFNNLGLAVGDSEKYVGGVDVGVRAMRWSVADSDFTELGNFGVGSNGKTTSFALNLNTAGAAVGWTQRFDDNGALKGNRATLWNAGSATAIELANLGLNSSGSTYTQANAINDSGAIAGWASCFGVGGADLGSRAVRWDAASGNVTELGTLGTDSSGKTNCSAIMLTSAGDAVGTAESYSPAGADLGPRAVVWNRSGTTAHELPNLGTNFAGWTQSSVTATNSFGIAVGTSIKYANDLEMGARAMRWNLNDLSGQELGNLGLADQYSSSSAYGVNSRGDIVGESAVGDIEAGVGAAVLWPAGSDTPIDLNSLIDPASGWNLVEGFAINDAGTILGFGWFDPDGAGGAAAYQRLFVMQVPEPAILPIGAIGLLLAYRRARTKN